jgi:hypothetical protein
MSYPGNAGDADALYRDSVADYAADADVWYPDDMADYADDAVYPDMAQLDRKGT